MKKILFLFVGFLPLYGIAQQTEGVATYLETVQLKIDMPEEHKEMMKNMPTSQSFSKVLFFNENESLYKDPDVSENEDVEMGHESDGMHFKMVMKRPESTFYRNTESSATIHAREFFGRDFLVTGEQKTLPWKFAGEQKTILGYVCQKATLKDGDRNIEAWFAPQIAVTTGPDNHAGLPGLILEVSIDGGDRTIVATNVELKKLDKGAITKPTKGKKVTQEEFDKIEEEKRKEMEQEFGGSGKGGMRVIIRN